ncbi:maleylpyruvate isomerase family mycothiol-dependent enzyme [Actinomadura rudentiformis]|uniref:Maleylpyruvate isomerase family mycothiol-dependent enzyme n=1 Tax=Actinomadura rudentiformis TaxID=359158 RepID=A0A6H9YH81_9ACTN|nr:maleylpyruvate isomerase family mycothiol-dependent enzyme [Actinomadura rudentiformis]KAB2345146.1 maleylpyruvate isomerase family mycothiol-dependent enzyme [Actinomadura rudentiformis]
MASETLRDLNPFDILDTEYARLDVYFTVLDESDWAKPSRCDGWTVRDVLAHLAGEELYNHACLDDDLEGLFALLDEKGVKDLSSFNDWTVDERRDLPVAEVLAEWRTKSGETRRRMRELGADATMATMVGQYPVGLQAFHLASEFATHADDVGVPVTPEEEPARTAWRGRLGVFVLGEQEAEVQVKQIPGGYRVTLDDKFADLSAVDFVDATTRRLPPDYPLDPDLCRALVCLA